MVHPEIQRFLVGERIEELQRSAEHVKAVRRSAAVDTSRIELRLCRVDDDPALAQLAELSGRELPRGRFVLAVVDGRIVAALPLVGGQPLADPFVRTAHLFHLLEVRAEQLRGPHERRSFLPRSAALIRSLV